MAGLANRRTKPKTAAEAINRMTAAHRAKIEAAVPAKVIGSFSSQTAREAVNQLTRTHRAKIEKSATGTTDTPHGTV